VCWALALTVPEFERQLSAMAEEVLVDTAKFAEDASTVLGLDLDVGPVVAELSSGQQKWLRDCLAQYSAYAGVYGTKETTPKVQQATDQKLAGGPSGKDGSTESAGKESKRSQRSEEEPRAFVLGTAGLPNGRPSGVPFASTPSIQKLLETKPHVAPLVNHIAKVEHALAEAEVAFRERELAEQWRAWSGVHPWEDKPDLEITDCPWWTAGADYVFRITAAWRKHSSGSSGRTEAALSKQLKLTATWVYRSRVFAHDAVHASNPTAEDLFGERNLNRFVNFALLSCRRKFAESDLGEWRDRAAVLAGATADLNQPAANSSSGVSGLPAQATRDSVAKEARESRKATKPSRRNIKYESIDEALSNIAKARPKNHEEVFRFLNDRKVPFPDRKPFKVAGGWLKGFRQNRHEASGWLSQAWGRLGLPAFARGPKK